MIVIYLSLYNDVQTRNSEVNSVRGTLLLLVAFLLVNCSEYVFFLLPL